jgi:type VI protein secretion system component VasK
MKDLHAPSQVVRRKTPTELVSFDGAALLWIDAILLVPAIFGLMFLPTIARALALSVIVALLVTYALLYWWARVHPASAGAHLLDALHIGPTRRVTS